MALMRIKGAVRSALVALFKQVVGGAGLEAGLAEVEGRARAALAARVREHGPGAGGKVREGAAAAVEDAMRELGGRLSGEELGVVVARLRGLYEGEGRVAGLP